MKLETRLPNLTTVLDVAGLAPEYAGIQVEVRLNPDFPVYEAPVLAAPAEPEPWQTELYFRRARFLKRVTIPGKFVENGQDLTVEIDGDAAKLWELETAEGFDPRITQWGAMEVILRREELWEGRLKN